MIKKIIKLLLTTLLLIVFMLVAWSLVSSFLDRNASPTNIEIRSSTDNHIQITPTIYFDPMPLVLELRNQSMLVTATKVIQRVDSIEYNQDGNFIQRLQSEKIEMLFTGEVSAGVDLGYLTEKDVSVEGKLITLRLPQAQVFNAPVVKEDFVLSHEKGLGTEILGKEDPNLQSGLRAKVTLEMIEEAKQDVAFIQAANNQAVAIVSGLANSLVPDPYQVIVTTGP